MLQKSNHTMSRDALGGVERLPQSGDKRETEAEKEKHRETVRDRVREWPMMAGIF